MAGRPTSPMAGGDTPIIDLTTDDDDDDVQISDSPSRPIPLFAGSSSNGAPSRPAAAGPSYHHSHDRLPTRPAQESEERAHDVRPPKRRRTQEPSSEPNTQPQTQEELAAALVPCLTAQVFPHIERATDKLPTGIYDLSRLGERVIGTIVNRDFVRQFQQGGGRLTSTTEITMAAGIHRLVIELASGPDYRLAPPDTLSAPAKPPPGAADIAPSSTMPAILPSIENDVENHVNGHDDDDEDEEMDDVDHDGGKEGKDEHGFEDVHEDEDDHEHEHEDVVKPHIRTSPRRRPPEIRKKARGPVSPQQLRARAKAAQWQSGKSYNLASKAPVHHSFGLPIRPYQSAVVRQQIISGVRKAFLPLESTTPPSQVFHVDFDDAEVSYLQYVARKLYGRPVLSGSRSTLRDIRNVLKKLPSVRASLAKLHNRGYVGYDPPPVSLKKRSSEDIRNFLNDLYAKTLNTKPRSLFIEYSDSVAQTEASRANQIPSLLLSREITGNRLGAARTYYNFMTTVKSNREDYLEPQIEWTNCAGDIMTVSWLSNTEFICGTTTHSDSHNQQYNKPGNLLLGSAATTTLRAYPDHRIIRPVVSAGDNAMDSMIASQDPWLFTSVVSSDYDPSCDLAFTSSFDKTVKVWKPEDGSMTALGTWEHGGRVNFVVTSKNGTATVATAADVPMEAVRVYHLDPSNISGSRYDSYSCTRIHDEDYIPSEKWAYYPAAIRWGLAPGVNHLLLIGYSPRSPTGEDHEIPEEKLDTGELCLWDTDTRMQVRVSSAKTQNVFEVAWHPSRASFAAATSASRVLEKTEQVPRTQVRIFEFNIETGLYSPIKTLDCTAIDINELSIMPNCLLYSYVAASCTDGRVYVWDTAGSDLPMCVLEHGDPVDELMGDREREDVGVKFMAWATTPDRLYTGSSDGVVKVWNVRHGKGVLVKDLIEVAAPITYGAFSPDFTRLVIGDGSGRVYLLALEDTESEDPPQNAGPSTSFVKIQTRGVERAVRRPRPFLPHPELPPPGVLAHNQLSNKLMEGQESARGYLATAQLTIHPDPTIGVIQGVNYATSCLFRTDAHVNGDPNEPLSANFQEKQQHSQRSGRDTDFRRIRLLRQPRREDNSGSANTNSWHEDLQAEELGEYYFNSNDTQLKPDYLDYDSWLALKAEKAELDDRLIELELDYETSILDSDDENDERNNEVTNDKEWFATVGEQVNNSNKS
ncbi:WD40 repeat-like protein [Nemania sp. NC0429]|nr:WD40 repeat-like protein [Nemania sp. NC0429]